MLAMQTKGGPGAGSKLKHLIMPVKSIYQTTTVAPVSTQLPKSVAQNPTLGGAILQANSPAKTTTGLGGLLGNLPAPVTSGLGSISKTTGLSTMWVALGAGAVIVVAIVAIARG